VAFSCNGHVVFIGRDSGLGSANKPARFHYRVKRSGHFESERVSNRACILFDGLGICSCSFSGCGDLTARVNRHADNAADVQVVNIGHIVEVQCAKIDGFLVQERPEHHDRIVGPNVG
jgi:hypothetical protein